MNFVELKISDGSWSALKANWLAQCESFSEEFETYAPHVFSVLEPLATDGHDRAWVYALEEDGEFHGICQLNRTPLPGYEGLVLRVRFMTFAPRLDFGDDTVSDYIDVLGNFFVQVYRISLTTLKSKYVKIHMRSPADRTFFDSFRKKLVEHPNLGAFEIHGMWLQISHTDQI